MKQQISNEAWLKPSLKTSVIVFMIALKAKSTN